MKEHELFPPVTEWVAKVTLTGIGLLAGSMASRIADNIIVNSIILKTEARFLSLKIIKI